MPTNLVLTLCRRTYAMAFATLRRGALLNPGSRRQDLRGDDSKARFEVGAHFACSTRVSWPPSCTVGHENASRNASCVWIRSSRGRQSVAVDQPLGLNERRLVERRDAPGKVVHVGVEFVVGKRAVHPTVALCGSIASKSSPPRMISSALARPTSRGRRSIPPPPGKTPALTSICAKIARS